LKYFLMAARSRVLVLACFLIVHLALIHSGLTSAGTPMSDISRAYQPWADFTAKTHIFLGLNRSWVYPFPNLIFIIAPYAAPWLDYQTAWLTMATFIDLVAMGVLLYWGSKFAKVRTRAAWVWAFGLGLLGPVGVSRLDTISIALAVIGLTAWINLKPGASAIWFALATWIKVWPIALLAAALAATEKRKAVLLYGLGSAFTVLIIGFMLGDPHSVLGFAFEQSDRGIQIESPWAAWWLWQGINKVPGNGLYYDSGLQTFQVQGQGTVLLANLLGPVMYGALAITCVLAWLAQRNVSRMKADASIWLPRVLAWGSLTGVLDLIVFNKVGSPQYFGWLVLPALIFTVYRPKGWQTVVGWVLGLMALTGLIYPMIYFAILDADISATSVLGIRNLLAIGLLVLANIRLTALGSEKSLVVQ